MFVTDNIFNGFGVSCCLYSDCVISTVCVDDAFEAHSFIGNNDGCNLSAKLNTYIDFEIDAFNN